MTDTKIDRDKAKGRAKEAAGVLTGNQHLKNEGRIDQARSAAKTAIDRVADTLSGAADSLIGRNRGKKQG